MFASLTVLFSCLQLVPAFETQAPLRSDPASPLNSKFGSLVNETLKLWHVPGLSIGVVDGDDTWAEGYGIASFPDIPVAPSTLFYGGSTTKAFTAAAMSFLVDDNENYPNVQWDTPISNLIRDDFVLENNYATTHITIEDALSHRSGMPRHDFSYGGTYDGHKGMLKDVVRSLRYLPLTAEPRTKFQYCNMMYMVASYVIETLEGRWLGDILRERIWKPLGMKSTYFSNEDAKQGPDLLAQGYSFYNDKYQPVPLMDLSIVSGAGSVISNVLDYSKWIKAFIELTGPISAASYKSLKTSRSLVPEDDWSSFYTGPRSYALGWDHEVYKGHEFFQHNGGMEGFGTEVIIFPALKYGLVSFGNTGGTSNVVEEILLWHLIDEKLGIPEVDRFDWAEKWRIQMKEKEDRYQNAVKIYYPSLPDPPLPPSIPILNYTGTYHHPAYRNIEIEMKDDALFAKRSATWKVVLDFKHVSGDYFMAYVDSTTAPGLIFKEAVPAEFTVGSDGVPKKFGLAAEPEMGLEGRIWFERV